MRSIIYAGHDFSELCSAEVVAKSANPIIAEALQVPGRAGAMLVTGYLPPVDVTVRLFLDAGFSADVVRLAELRHKLSFWLCAPGGGELVLPDEPEHTYRDALLVSAGAWSKLFSDGQCEITFTLFDPIAYGRERIERLSRFDVGGTWPALPEFRLVAAASSSVRVGHALQNRFVTIDYEFAGGEAVVIDCATERVYINDADARDCVALGSDFFSLDPGDRIVSVYGATYFETRFVERWA
ncbi:MAG: phage tail family protein [Eggerthellaceae bacterium]|nr:phage tail family protein [Eggerthellaceae bacterium]